MQAIRALENYAWKDNLPKSLVDFQELKYNKLDKFDELVDKKMKKYNINREKAYEEIIKSSSKTNEDVNAMFDVEENIND